MSDWRRDLLVSLSLANLVYIRSWAEVLTFDRNAIYWLKSPPPPAYFLGLILAIVALTVLIWLVLRQMARAKNHRVRRFLPFVFIVPLLTLLNSVRTLIGTPGQSLFLQFVQQRALAIGAAMALLAVIGLMVGGQRAQKLISGILLLFFPLTLLAFGQAIYRIIYFDPSPMADQPAASFLPAKPAGAPRFLWVIFDEWDQQLSFAERPHTLALPEIDRLRAQSLMATNTDTPAMMTDVSMPALITGRRLANVQAHGSSELLVQPAASREWLPWSQQPNVFDQARALGFNTAVVAWAIPYCRVINRSLSGCWWWSGSSQYNSTGTTAAQVFFNLPRGLFETVYRSPFGQSLSTVRHESTYENVLRQSEAAIASQQFGLILLHLPVPHPPYFYDPSTGRFTWGDHLLTGLLGSGQDGYLGGLALVDRSIGELRSLMEQKGLWDSTSILFSADHPFRHRPAFDGRPVDHRVPFLLKLAGQERELHYDAPFSALLSKDLMLAVLGGQIATSGQAVAWLDRHAPSSLSD